MLGPPRAKECGRRAWGTVSPPHEGPSGSSRGAGVGGGAYSVLCWSLYLLHLFDGQLEATEAEILGQQEVEVERGAKPGAQ